MDITAGGDFLGLSDQKFSCKHVSVLDCYGIMGIFLILIHVLV